MRILLLALVLGAQLVVNTPSKDVDVVHLPGWVSDDTLVCVDYVTATSCIKVKELRVLVKHHRTL